MMPGLYLYIQFIHGTIIVSLYFLSVLVGCCLRIQGKLFFCMPFRVLKLFVSIKSLLFELEIHYFTVCLRTYNVLDEMSA